MIWNDICIVIELDLVMEELKIIIIEGWLDNKYFFFVCIKDYIVILV